MPDLDEVLDRNTDGKISWLVSKVYDMDNRISIIENNHLVHLELELKRITRILLLIIGIGGTILTGINFL